MIKKKLRNVRLTRKVKGFILTACTAVLIGFVFGMLSLQMTKQEAHTDAAKVNSSIQNEKEEAEAYTMNDISFYVVQAGVFSEKENADKWAASFSEQGYVTIHWVRDHHIYLLTSIAASFEEATNSANQMKTENFDVYVKEWEVEPIHLKLPEADHNWLVSMLDLWEKSLQKSAEEGTIPKHEWEQLVQTDGLGSASILSLKEKIEKHLQADTLDKPALLELIALYEKTF